MVVLAQFFLHDRLAGEAADQRIACGHVLQHGVVRPRIVLFEYPDDAAQKVSDARLGVGNEAEHGGVGVPVRLERLVGCPFPIEQRRSESRLVVFFDPVGQFFEIITARYPCAVSRVHPVDVRRRPSANDSRIGIGSQRDRFRFRVAFLEPVAQRGGGQVQRRIATHPGIAVQSGNGRIGDQVHRIVRRKIDPVFDQIDAVARREIIPTFRDHAVTRRGSPRDDRSQPGYGIGLHIAVAGVREVSSLLHESAESIVAEIVAETVQIVVTHLAHDDLDDQPGLDCLLGARFLTADPCSGADYQVFERFHRVWFV